MQLPSGEISRAISVTCERWFWRYAAKDNCTGPVSQKIPECSEALFRRITFVLGWLTKPEELTPLLPHKRDNTRL